MVLAGASPDLPVPSSAALPCRPVPFPEFFTVEFQPNDDGKKDFALIKLEDQARTLAEVQAACQRYGVRARLMRGDTVHGWVEADGRFSPGGPIR